MGIELIVIGLVLRTFSVVVRRDARCLFRHGTWESGGETWLARLEGGYRSTQMGRRISGGIGTQEETWGQAPAA